MGLEYSKTGSFFRLRNERKEIEMNKWTVET